MQCVHMQVQICYLVPARCQGILFLRRRESYRVWLAKLPSMDNLSRYICRYLVCPGRFQSRLEFRQGFRCATTCTKATVPQQPPNHQCLVTTTIVQVIQSGCISRSSLVEGNYHAQTRITRLSRTGGYCGQLWNVCIQIVES